MLRKRQTGNDMHFGITYKKYSLFKILTVLGHFTVIFSINIINARYIDIHCSTLRVSYSNVYYKNVT